MIAAIYARKSNPQEGAAGTSEHVDRQLAHCRLYATEQGWTVDEARVYADADVIGSRRCPRTLTTQPGEDTIRRALE